MPRKSLYQVLEPYLPNSYMPKKYTYSGGFAEFCSTDQFLECRFFKDSSEPDYRFDSCHSLIVFHHGWGTSSIFPSQSRIEKGLVFFSKEAEQGGQFIDALVPVERNPGLIIMDDQQVKEWAKKLRVYLKDDHGFHSEYRIKIFKKPWSGTSLITKMHFRKSERKYLFGG